MKQYKIILISVLLSFFAVQSFAQRQVISPFTRFGYGELFEPSLVFTQMGGIGNSVRSSNHINFMNAAHHSAISKETFLFEVGAGYSIRNVRKGSLSAISQRVGLEYFAMAFPVIPQRWGMALALMPFSSVNYEMVEYDHSIGARYDYIGDGGMNQVKWGNSVTLLKHLSLGVNAAFVFGNSIYNSIVQFPEFSTTAYRNTLKSTTYNTHGFYFDFGAQYVWKLNEMQNIIFGVTYQNQSSLTYSETATLSSFVRNYTDVKDPNDFQDLPQDTVSNVVTEGLRTDLPQRISMGVGYESKRLKGGVDFGWQQWKNVNVFGTDYSNLETKKFLKIGAELAGNDNSTNYFKRLPYRAGFHISQMPVFYTINGADYKPYDFGVSFGTEFFLRQNTNSFNVSFDIGRRGELPFSHNLYEKYVIMKVKVNLKERWFFRQKID
ncbi:MAG: hypothetical protein LBU90_02285 [Bacteroidales bacterium]|jgi:hypothetical protein|nr:hypothetical protein [Bacteroidales bacterium]